MNEQLWNFIQIMGAMAVFFFFVAYIVNWLSIGFFGTWLRVRASRGRKWLIKVWTVSDTYYSAGSFDGKVITFKDRNKKSRKIRVIPTAVYRSYGVSCVEVDEERNAVRVMREYIDDKTGKKVTIEEDDALEDAISVKGGFVAVPGFDAVLFDGMIKRALMLAQMRTNKDRVIVFFLLVLILGGVAWLAWHGMRLEEILKSLSTVGGGTV